MTRKLCVTGSQTFALEMMRACLGQPQIRAGYQLTGLWNRINMEYGGSRRTVLIALDIDGAPSSVSAHCEMEREHGKWVRGTCTIELAKDTGQRWVFTCMRSSSSLDVKPVSFSKGLNLESPATN